jgi:catechol 2,3-dioxygenase-like lactoylglutathione lyase family enzyme
VSASLTRVGAITLFVESAQRSRAFYEEVFGLPVAHEDEDSAAAAERP